MGDASLSGSRLPEPRRITRYSRYNASGVDLETNIPQGFVCQYISEATVTSEDEDVDVTQMIVDEKETAGSRSKRLTDRAGAFGFGDVFPRMGRRPMATAQARFRADSRGGGHEVIQDFVLGGLYEIG